MDGQTVELVSLICEWMDKTVEPQEDTITFLILEMYGFFSGWIL